MRESEPRTVRDLLLALHVVEDELRAARQSADRAYLSAVIERKRRILTALARHRILHRRSPDRRPNRSAVA